VRFDNEWYRNYKRCLKHNTFYDRHLGCAPCNQDAADRLRRNALRNRLIERAAIAVTATGMLAAAFWWAEPHAKSLDDARVPENVRLYDLRHGG
jgi:hypothetical protein